jgi:hypothetical protein
MNSASKGNPRKIVDFSDGTSLEFDVGKFDAHCVFYIQATGERTAPRDSEYFQDMLDYSEQFGVERVYKDFVSIFELSLEEVSKEDLEKISKIAETYVGRASQIEKTFVILYAAMIAENRKEFTRLGKRIKRLGIHNIFFDGFSIIRATNFSKGKGWKEIDALCQVRGF